MRRFVAWIGGAAGGLAAYRFLRRHAAVEPLSEPAPPEPDERAEELRAKLAETRAAEKSATEGPSVTVEEPAADAAPPEASAEPVPGDAAAEPVLTGAATEPAAEEPSAEPVELESSESLDERRRRVYEEGRAALDEMQSE